MGTIKAKNRPLLIKKNSNNPNLRCISGF